MTDAPADGTLLQELQTDVAVCMAAGVFVLWLAERRLITDLLSGMSQPDPAAEQLMQRRLFLAGTRSTGGFRRPSAAGRKHVGDVGVGKSLNLEIFVDKCGIPFKRSQRK